MNFDLTILLAIIIPLILAITLHEVAHGFVALRFGDRTAQMCGRLTLNPIKHIDPIGTIVVPLVLYFLGAPIFGWAKPVPINTRNLKDPIRDMRWVALAGPMANVLMAATWAAIGLLFGVLGVFHLGNFPLSMVAGGIYINIILAVFNLIPILPSDGGRLLYSVLPWKWAMQYRRTEPYGMLIIAVLIMTPVIGWLLQPFSELSRTILSLVVGGFI